MAQPILVQDAWERMERDRPRNQLRKGSAHNLVDYLPNLVSPLRGRGGWGNASDLISDTVATATYQIAGIYANYSAGVKNLTWDEDGNVVSFVTAGTVTNIGASRTPKQNPVFHRDKVIVCDDDGTTAPQKLTNSGGTVTIAALGGTPPTAIYAVTWEDRTLLARSSANTNRIWFSDAGDPEGWDTTNVYLDVTDPITGLAALRRTVLLFHESTLSRIVGSIPPPDTDFDVADPLFHVGCTDARSIAYWRDRVVFASQEGIFITDGSGEPASITRLCGMQSYWRELLGSYDPTTWTIVGEVLQDHYVVSIMDGSTFKDGALIDMNKMSWLRMSNFNFRSMWRAEAAADELYAGRRDAARVAKLSTIFRPDQSANKNDGDGDAVTPVLETPWFKDDGNAEIALRELLVGYELTDHATDNPTLSLSYVKTPEATSYTAITGSLAENSKLSYGRKDLGFEANGVAFKVAKNNAGDVKLWSLEIDAHAREGSSRSV